MPTKFNMTKDVAGYNGFGLVPSTDAYAGTLAANTADSTLVPSEYDYYLAVFSFSPGSNIWVDFKTTATVPSGAISAVTTELNPAARLVKKGTTISFITSDTTTPAVSILFYVAPTFTN